VVSIDGPLIRQNFRQFKKKYLKDPGPLNSKNVFERINNFSRGVTQSWGVRGLKQGRGMPHVQIMAIPERFSPLYSLSRNGALRVSFLTFFVIYLEKSRSGSF
jgi:hypothetical protein